MARFTLVTVVIWPPASTLAGPRWCSTDQPGAIFCDDIDRYCIVPPIDPNDACLPVGDGCVKDNDAARSIWVPTAPHGAEVNIDECIACGGVGFVTTDPFALGHPNQGAGRLGYQTVRLQGYVANTFGSGIDAVAGTDANPLILDFIMNGQTAEKITYANVYFELSFYDLMTGLDDRAPTDYVTGPNCYTECDGYDSEFPMLCQQDVPPAGCPDIATAPHHASIAVGAVSFLDKDPCHCSDPQLSSPNNEHLAVFDGYKWRTLPGPFTGSGDFMMRDLDNVIRLTITSTMFKVEMTALNPDPDEYSWCEIPRDYLGPFNTLHLGFGMSCLIDLGSWTCANETSGDRRYRAIKGSPGAGRPVYDNIALYGGEGRTTVTAIGACCLTTGQCLDGVTEYVCEMLHGGDWRGLDSTCASEICCPDPFADADGDGDVDQKDFGVFQACFTGPGPVDPVPSGQCTCFDRDFWGWGDGDVDEIDFVDFEACLSGPTVPVDPTCDDDLHM